MCDCNSLFWMTTAARPILSSRRANSSWCQYLKNNRDNLNSDKRENVFRNNLGISLNSFEDISSQLEWNDVRFCVCMFQTYPHFQPDSSVLFRMVTQLKTIRQQDTFILLKHHVVTKRSLKCAVSFTMKVHTVIFLQTQIIVFLRLQNKYTSSSFC